MDSFLHAVRRSGGVASVAGALLISGRTGVFLAIGLAALSLVLIAILALVGTFGSAETRQAAQAVLAILMTGNRGASATPCRKAPADRSPTPTPSAGSGSGPPP
jgi:hypothetical protein